MIRKPVYIYFDVYDNFEDFKREHPFSSYIFGYVVFDTEYGYIPDVCNDWNDSPEEAMFDYEENYETNSLKIPIIKLKYLQRKEEIVIITKEMIENGFKTKCISIENEYGGCISLCCKIGDNAFYFAGSDDILTEKEWWENYTLKDTVSMLYDILKDKEAAELNGIDEDELYYYQFVLGK